MRYCGLVYIVLLLMMSSSRTQSSTNDVYTVRTTNGAIIIRARTRPISRAPAEPAGAAPVLPNVDHGARVQRVHHIEPMHNEVQSVTVKIRPATFD